MTSKFTDHDIEEIIVRLRAKGFRSLESGRDPLRNTAAADHNHNGTYATAGHNHDGTYAAAGHTHTGVYEPAITAGTSSQVLLGDKSLGTPSTVNGSSGLGQTILTPFSVLLVAANAATTTDAQTIYWGGCAGVAPSSTANTQCVFFPMACKIVGAYIWALSGTAGTAENWQINLRKNNTTDTLVQTVGANATVRTWYNLSLDIALAAGDRIEVKSVNPTWATNPANVRFGGLLYMVPN